MDTPLSILCIDIADRLEHESFHSAENRQTHYMAAKLIRAFNDMFEPTWAEVNRAEQMRKDMAADRKAGKPWIGDDGR